jgi:carbonic anhydrase
VSVTDELLRNAEDYAARFTKRDLPLPPAKKIAIVACMDARLDPQALLGLEPGDAHVIRNVGGVITEDELRSLSISQRRLGTEEVVLIHHTDCGLLAAAADERAHVRASIERVRASPLVPRKESVRGFVYEVETGRLREVI